MPLSNLKPQEVRDMLKKHLGWTYDNYDDFTSWTSSLLYALQRAVYAHRCRDHSIHVCMIDTWKVHGFTFYHAEELLTIYEAPEEFKYPFQDYSVEYLTVGELTLNAANSHSVSFTGLISGELYTLVPHLRASDISQRSGRLWIPFSDMRKGWPFSVPTEINENDLRLARSMTRDVCLSLRLVLFINLLSLQKRSPKEELFLDYVAENFFRKCIGPLILEWEADVERPWARRRLFPWTGQGP